MRYIVGNLQQNGKTVGYAVLKVDSKSGECKTDLLSFNTLRSHYRDEKFENAEWDGDRLIGTKGVLDKSYVNISVETGLEDRQVVTVLGTDYLGNYYVALYNRSISTFSIKKVTSKELKESVFRKELEISNMSVKMASHWGEIVLKSKKGRVPLWYDKVFVDKVFECRSINGKRHKWRVEIRKAEKSDNAGFMGNRAELKDTAYFYMLMENEIPYGKDAFPGGQYVASYYIETIKNHNNFLSLYADVPAWSIDKESMESICKWLKSNTADV